MCERGAARGERSPGECGDVGTQSARRLSTIQILGRVGHRAALQEDEDHGLRAAKPRAPSSFGFACASSATRGNCARFNPARPMEPTRSSSPPGRTSQVWREGRDYSISISSRSVVVKERLVLRAPTAVLCRAARARSGARFRPLKIFRLLSRSASEGCARRPQIKVLTSSPSERPPDRLGDASVGVRDRVRDYLFRSPGSALAAGSAPLAARTRRRIRAPGGRTGREILPCRCAGHHLLSPRVRGTSGSTGRTGPSPASRVHQLLAFSRRGVACENSPRRRRSTRCCQGSLMAREFAMVRIRWRRSKPWRQSLSRAHRAAPDSTGIRSAISSTGSIMPRPKK